MNQYADATPLNHIIENAPLCTLCARFGRVRSRCLDPVMHVPSFVNEQAKIRSRTLYRLRMNEKRKQNEQ